MAMFSKGLLGRGLRGRGVDAVAPQQEELKVHRPLEQMFRRLDIKSARIVGTARAQIQPVTQVEQHWTEIANGTARGSDGIGAIFNNTASVIAAGAALITYPIDHRGLYRVVFMAMTSGGIRDVQTLESSDPGASDVKIWGATGTGSSATSPTELAIYVPRDGDFLILRSVLGLASGNMLSFVYTCRIG